MLKSNGKYWDEYTLDTKQVQNPLEKVETMINVDEFRRHTCKNMLGTQVSASQLSGIGGRLEAHSYLWKGSGAVWVQSPLCPSSLPV